MKLAGNERWKLSCAAILLAFLVPNLAIGQYVASPEQGYPASSLSLNTLEGKEWESAIVNPLSALYANRKTRLNNRLIKPFVIAIARNEATSTRFVLTKKKYDAAKANPEALKGIEVAVTASSTAHLRLFECLDHHKLGASDADIKFDGQASSSSNLSAGKIDAAVLWRPFDRLAEDGKSKAKELTCGEDPDMLMPALWVARSDLLQEPEDARRLNNLRDIAVEVAKALGEWEQIRRMPESQAKKLIEWYKARGATISMAEALQEIDERQPPSFDEQLTLFHSPRQDPSVAAILDRLSDYLVSSGVLRLDEKPDTDALVHGSVLEFISTDPSLAAVARGETPPAQ